MLGRLASCPSTEKEACPPCYTPCSHSDKVREEFTQSAGTKGLIKLIIDTHLEQQETFLKELCDSSLSLLKLAELAGMRCTNFDSFGCQELCNNLKAVYKVASCKKDYSCSDFDNNFFIAVLRARRINKKPTRRVLTYIANLFGWSVIYTKNFIALDIGNDDPAKAFSVLHFFPTPIGEELIVVGNC